MEKGSVSYHKRTDFRALDVFIDAINQATKEELLQARATCKEMASDMRMSHAVRPVWRDLQVFLTKQIGRF